MGSDSLIDLRNFFCWAGQQGRTSIGDAVEVSGHGFASDGQGIDLELPVGLFADWDVEEVALVVVAISAAQGQLATLRSAVRVAAQPEGEHGLLALRVLHQVGERTGDIVDSDRIVAHTKDTIELADEESTTRFDCAFGESLLIDAHGAVLAAELQSPVISSGFQTAVVQI